MIFGLRVTLPKALMDDMAFLCESRALEQVSGEGGVQHVNASLADRPILFNGFDSDAGHVSEAFPAVDNSCIWEAL